MRMDKKSWETAEHTERFPQIYDCRDLVHNIEKIGDQYGTYLLKDNHRALALLKQMDKWTGNELETHIQ